ncbi:c-type cytochrome [Massilia horti]|uniref:c-type cytochrome n=1 Tax=Massilia horti TaxID=2562153 RepID=UPI001E4532DA|nr:c-type cytochrome [Massilia horti]
MKANAGRIAAALFLFWLTVASCRAGAGGEGGDAARGKAAIERHACTACHVIPNIPGSGGNVGPPLSRMGERSYIAGELPNTRTNMVRWLRHPQAVVPRTAMPELGIDETEARDMAAFLATLK